MNSTFIIWDRSDWESSAIDMDTDEEVGFCWSEEGRWKAEARGARIAQHFRTMREAEMAVEAILEQEETDQ